MVQFLYQASNPVQKTIGSKDHQVVYGGKIKPWNCLISEAATGSVSLKKGVLKDLKIY